MLKIPQNIFSRKKIYSPVTIFVITNLQKAPILSSNNMVKHGKKKQLKSSSIQNQEHSSEYRIFHAKSQRQFTKTYRGEWEQASKKAWRDLKQIIHNSDLVFDITNLNTEESRRYDFRGWVPQKKSYHKERNEKLARLHQF